MAIKDWYKLTFLIESDLEEIIIWKLNELGIFSFSFEYLIKNGKLTKPVKGATLIGEAKEVMPKISMCGNDLELAPGFCGSISGSVNVTVGQPHIKVDSITVGGR